MKKRLPELKEQIANNWIYKIVALLVALSIWATTLENRKEVMRSREIEVHFYINTKKIVDLEKDYKVFIKVVGSKNLVKKYIQFTNSITVNLSGLNPGPNRVELKNSDFNLPSGLKLLSVEPKFFEIKIDEVK